MITYTWWQSDTSDEYVLHIPDNNLIEVDNNLTDTLDDDITQLIVTPDA